MINMQFDTSVTDKIELRQFIKCIPNPGCRFWYIMMFSFIINFHEFGRNISLTIQNQIEHIFYVKHYVKHLLHNIRGTSHKQFGVGQDQANAGQQQ